MAMAGAPRVWRLFATGGASNLSIEFSTEA
jgi:hypothetical protein